MLLDALMAGNSAINMAYLICSALACLQCSQVLVVVYLRAVAGPMVEACMCIAILEDVTMLDVPSDADGTVTGNAFSPL